MMTDWTALLASWDQQQGGYLPHREQRFDAMLDAAGAHLGTEFLALDLACGPGAISQRLLRRFPAARAVAVDVDPVLLAIGQGALGAVHGRLRWVDADLSHPDWVAGLGEESFDAVLSTTALHWFLPEQLAILYRQLGALVRPGGVLLIADNMPFDAQSPGFSKICQAVTARRRDQAFSQHGTEDWDQWWASLRQHSPELTTLLEERTRRFGWEPTSQHRADRLAAKSNGLIKRSPTVSFHAGALREADFREVGVIWQDFDDHVLLAVR
jgi:trans-aconitate methyltransferase